jgi:hypothetical protein
MSRYGPVPPTIRIALGVILLAAAAMGMLIDPKLFDVLGKSRSVWHLDRIGKPFLVYIVFVVFGWGFFYYGLKDFMRPKE